MSDRLIIYIGEPIHFFFYHTIVRVSKSFRSVGHVRPQAGCWGLRDERYTLHSEGIHGLGQDIDRSSVYIVKCTSMGT